MTIKSLYLYNHELSTPNQCFVLRLENATWSRAMQHVVDLYLFQGMTHKLATILASRDLARSGIYLR